MLAAKDTISLSFDIVAAHGQMRNLLGCRAIERLNEPKSDGEHAFS